MKREFYNATGRALTKALFLETNTTDLAQVMYTLKDHPNEGFPSLYEAYMETEDPTEFQFAQKYLAGWAHWQMLVESTFFKEYVQRWRWELDLQIKAKALRRLTEEAKGGKNVFSANKFLIESGWLPKRDANNPVGRPTMERIKEEAARIVELDQEILDDHKRLN